MADPPASDCGRDRRHAIFDDAMDPAFVRGLMAHVEARRADFEPAGIYFREKGTELDKGTRDCMRLGDLAGYRAPFEAAVNRLAPIAAAGFGLDGGLVPAEFEICAYGDGGLFWRHQDLVQAPGRIRVLTCTYYFSKVPLPFQGGELRIHPWPAPLPGSDLPAIDVAPNCNRMVFLPSIIPHEVLTVRTRSPAWNHRRFNITCWLWRSVHRRN
jgi:hypothetical protein